MAQLVTRVADDLLGDVDALVTDGVVASRSDAVRRALEELVDRVRRQRIGQQIVDGYLRTPQRDDESLWTDEDTERMIAEEPW